MERAIAERTASAVLPHSPTLGRRPHRRFWPESGALASLPALDGLRAVAVLLTMLFHAWFVIPGIHDDYTAYDFPINYGRTGVQLFFVLSGFLLFQPYAHWLFCGGLLPSARKFYFRRLLRIGPAYWTSLAILMLLQPLTLRLLGDAALHALFLFNVSYATAYSFNSVYWTMAVEVQFYVALPGIAWLMGRIARRLGPARAVGLIVLALFLMSAACALLQATPLAQLPIAGNAVIAITSLPYWLGVFAAGIAVSALYVAMPSTVRVGGWRLLVLPVLAAGVILGVALVWLPSLHHLPTSDQLFGMMYACLLFATLAGPRALRQALSCAPLRFLGLISYSLYIWHMIVLRVLEFSLAQIADLPRRVLLGFTLDLLISVPIAYLSYQIVEWPFFGARKQARGLPRASAAMHFTRSGVERGMTSPPSTSAESPLD